ncbi:MAG TPA: porin family protein [Luteibaculaceae bacterium]|nr:porin family protein [Luteibaculaceae bacterium]
MRKTALAIGISLIALNALGQRKKFETRLIAGFTASQVQGDGYGGFDKAGLTAGAGIQWPVNKKSTLGFDLLYTQKGSRKIPDPENGDFTLYRLQLDYISVPVIYRYSFKKFIAIAGPEIAVLARSREQNQFGDVITPLKFKPLDIGINLGFGFRAGKRISLQMLLQESLLSIRETAPYAKGILGRFRGMYNTVIHTTLIYTPKNK